MEVRRVLLMSLIVLALVATMSGQTTLLQPRLAVRAVTTGDVAKYKLPSTTQFSGGMNTVALGEPLYLEVQIDQTIPASQIAGVIWTLTTKPSGSNAAISDSPLGSDVPIAEPSDRQIYQVAGRKLLKPDVHGMYIVSATVTAGSSGTTTVAQTYIAGTYVGVAACQRCHGGGLAQAMVPSWKKTLHAEIFTDNINGASGTHYSANCLPCHMVGYDVNNPVDNGGFLATSKKLNWVFPTPAPGAYDAVPAALQALSNIQCENCHGPGSEHANYGGDVIAITKPANTGACQQCHDAPTHHIKGTSWNNSMHAVATRDAAGNANCVGCHTGNGFIQKMAGAKITDTAYHAIDCGTCHEPHGQTAPSDAQHLVRNMTAATLADGTKITNAGTGTLCMQCHMARQNASIYVDGTAGSARYGPHHGPQADMLAGANAYTYGQQIPSSAHQYVTTNACVDCHMQTVADTTSPAFTNAGDHTFKASFTPAGKAKIELTAACQNCHGKQITTFNFALFDYNGDGVIEGVQTEVQKLLDQVSTMLPPDNKVKTSLAIDNTWTKPQLEAAYNWQFVNNDGSKGVHNTAYAVGLLKASINNLKSH